jgi:hypothetical protein
MSTHNWNHAQQHMECTIYCEDEEESWVGLQNQLQAIHKLITGQNEPRSSCDGKQFEETWNPEFDIVQYSDQEQTTSLVSPFYHLEY